MFTTIQECIVLNKRQKELLQEAVIAIESLINTTLMQFDEICKLPRSGQIANGAVES